MEAFKFDNMQEVRIKDYTRHGVVWTRMHGADGMNVYGVLEPNLNSYYWREDDLSPYDPREGIANG